MNVSPTVTRCLEAACGTCYQFGASLKCSRQRCETMFHLECAKKSGGLFLEQKVNGQILCYFRIYKLIQIFMCSTHAPKQVPTDSLSSLSCCRKLFIDSDQICQVII